MKIDPSDVISIDVRQELEKIAPQILDQPGTFGSVVLRFTAPNYGNINAAVMVHEMGQPIGYHIDAFAEDPDYRAGSREGIWWLPRPGTQDNLIISNASNKPNQGTLFLYDATGKAWSQSIQLGPRQAVKLVVGDLVARAGLSGTYGGMKFVMAERAGYIDTVHFVYDETAGFSALMKMFDRDPKAKLEEHLFGASAIWTTRAPMLALENPDPALAFPPGTILQPNIFLRNTTAAPLTANVTLSWRGDTRKGVLALSAIRLRPNETRVIDVAALQENGQIPKDAHWAMVQISAPVKPDDLIAIASSYDSAGRYGAQTPFSDQLDNRWMGGLWQVDSTHNSIIAVTNAGKAATTAVLTFHYNGGNDTYQIKYGIRPGDQWWLNLGDVIHGSVADDQGRTFPSDLTEGTYELEQADDGTQPSLFEGKIIVDKTYGHLTYGCLECCTQRNAQMLANPENLLFQGQDNLGVWAYDSCFDDNEDVSTQFNTWDTNNHSVATMNVRQITGVGVGAADGTADGFLIGQSPRYCPQERAGAGNTNKVMPQIVWNGNKITNTTQSAITGQQIALSASYSLPSGVSVTSQSWSVAGTTIGGYNVTQTSASTVPTNFSGQSTTFYWVSAGNSLHITFTLNLSGGSLPTATASTTFNVTGVTSPGMQVQTPYNGQFSIDQLTGCSVQPSGPALVFGNVTGPMPGCTGTTTGTPGIQFTPQGTQPGAGAFKFAQILTNDTSTYYSSAGNYTCTNSVGLDQQYPYLQQPGVSYVTDAPELPLPSTYTPITRSFNATMYLLWQSSQSNSIPVPLAYQTWQFSGTATQSGSNWTQSGSGGPSGGVVLSSTYPTWTVISTKSCH